MLILLDVLKRQGLKALKLKRVFICLDVSKAQSLIPQSLKPEAFEHQISSSSRHLTNLNPIRSLESQPRTSRLPPGTRRTDLSTLLPAHPSRLPSSLTSCALARCRLDDLTYHPAHYSVPHVTE